jgi:hypothetical protein
MSDVLVLQQQRGKLYSDIYANTILSLTTPCWPTRLGSYVQKYIRIPVR